MKVYTLKNCDTCKKALKWLDENGIVFENHDVRADGLKMSDISPLMNQLGWETLINRRSTTWRGLSDDDKTDLSNEKAVRLIVGNPTLMKRPVFVTKEGAIAGFDNAARGWLQG